MDFPITLDEVEQRWERGWRRYRFQRWAVVWSALVLGAAGLTYVLFG